MEFAVYNPMDDEILIVSRATLTLIEMLHSIFDERGEKYHITILGKV